MQLESALKNIKMLVTDVDGVLTDGRIWIDSNGKWKRAFHVLDGVGLKFLMEAGFQVAVITGGDSDDVRQRINFLKIPHFYDGASNKVPSYEDLLKKTGIKPEEIAYIGDEVFDREIMVHTGFSVAVPRAVPEVKEIAHYTTKHEGGFGAVREVCDLLLKYGYYAKTAKK